MTCASVSDLRARSQESTATTTSSCSPGSATSDRPAPIAPELRAQRHEPHASSSCAVTRSDPSALRRHRCGGAFATRSADNVRSLRARDTDPRRLIVFRRATTSLATSRMRRDHAHRRAPRETAYFEREASCSGPAPPSARSDNRDIRRSDTARRRELRGADRRTRTGGAPTR